MSLPASRRPPAHLVLLAGCVSVILVLLAAASADAAAPAPSRRSAAVALAVPSLGDVSYAMVRVRVAPGKRLTMPAGLAGAVNIFSGRVGGLAIRARAANWRALRATTRVYVVVSNAQGAPGDERDVALFVVRRTGRGGGAGARVVFTLSNARAVVGSFWVHRVDRSGYADVFHARNIFSTALANWSRYTLALKLAGAVQAALHPRVRSVQPAPPAGMMTAAVTRAAGHARNPGPWTGGQRPDAHVKAIYSLLFGALHNPTAWGAFKGSAAVPSFIATELHNPSLANRWRTVVAKVPATVPDKYAALAQEEKRFTHVAAPRLGRLVVEIADSVNSATKVQNDLNSAPGRVLTVNNPDWSQTYGGRVKVTKDTVAGSVSQWCYVSICSFAYPLTEDDTFYIHGDPYAGASLLSLDGCPQSVIGHFDTCAAPGGLPSNPSVTARFAQSVKLTVYLALAGSVANDESRFPTSCSQVSTCTEELAIGSTVTFTAQPGGATPSSWAGCDQSSGGSCKVTMAEPRSVLAELDYTLTAGVQAAAGSGGTITSSVGGINCGVVASGVTPCAADIEAGQPVILTAHPDANSTFSSWSGAACAYATGRLCFVTMSQAETVTANFAPIPPPTPPPPPTTYPLSVSVSTLNSADTGYVTSSPAGIECGAVPVSDTSTCDASFDAGTTVTLTATLNQGLGSLDWFGCDTTAGYTCTVRMDAAKNVTAQFR